MIMEGRDFLKRSDLSVGEVTQIKGRLSHAEDELARLRAAGMFNQGIEVAVQELRARRALLNSQIEAIDIERDLSVYDIAIDALRSLLRPDDGGK